MNEIFVSLYFNIVYYIDKMQQCVTSTLTSRHYIDMHILCVVFGSPTYESVGLGLVLARAVGQLFIPPL